MAKKAVKEKPDAEKYFRLAKRYLREAKRYLREGNLRQASEKYWGAMAEAIKGWSEHLGMRHNGHAFIRENSERIFEMLNRPDLDDAFAHAEALHVNFYEDRYSPRRVKRYGKSVEEAVQTLLWEYEKRKD